MRDPGQLMRFNKIELGLFKTLFADNENLLFTIRKVLLQFELTEEEQKAIDAISPTGMSLIRKHFMGGIDPEAPLNQLADMRRGYAVEMQGKDVEEMTPIFQAKELQIDYLNQQFDFLEKANIQQEIKLDEMHEVKLKPKEKAYSDIMAWNNILSYVDSNLQQIQFLAGKSDETPEQTIKRLQKDSSK